MKQNYVVSFDVPEDVGMVDCIEYVRQAVQSFGGGFAPDDPFFGLDRESVGVRPLTRDDVPNPKSGMSKEEYIAFHEDACRKMIAITKAKNADYTGTSTDPFANFARVELMGICSTEQGFLTRMFDKFSRITSFVQKGVLQVADESIEDTLFDLANYCILFAGFIRAKKQRQ